MFSVVKLIVFASIMTPIAARLREPVCSQYDFQEKLLEKSVRYEHKLEVYEQKLNSWEAMIQTKLSEFDTAETARNEELKRVTNLYQHNVHDTNQKLTQAMEEMQQKYEDIKKKLEGSEKETNLSLEESLRKYDSELKAITGAYRTPTVMFSAKQMSDTDVSNGKEIKFTTLVSNIGNGYDKHTGEFSAPYSGSYMFHTSICSYVSKWLCVNLVANGTAIGSICQYNSAKTGVCTSNSGIAVLKKGDIARVEGSISNNLATYQGDSSRRPTFSGMLVHVEHGL